MQEIRNSGAIGYKYITVDEDEAANVIYANNVLLHLANELIPRGSAVSEALLISVPSLGVYYLLFFVVDSVCLSSCLSSVCLFVTQTLLLLFCFSMESSHFLAISSPWQKLQNARENFI